MLKKHQEAGCQMCEPEWIERGADQVCLLHQAAKYATRGHSYQWLRGHDWADVQYCMSCSRHLSQNL